MATIDATAKCSGYTFTWRIENAQSVIPNSSQPLKSPIFTADCLDKTKWQLMYHFGPEINSDILGGGDENSGEIFEWFTLSKEATEPYCMSLNYEFSILRGDNELPKTILVKRFWFHRGNSCGTSRSYPFKQAPRAPESEIQTPSLLIICCRMWKDPSEFCDMEQGFGRTYFGVERRSFIWPIENFSRLGAGIKNEEKLKTSSKSNPSLSIEILRNALLIFEGKLQVDVRKRSKRNVKTCYYMCSCDLYPYIADCQTSVLDAKGNAVIFENEEKFKVDIEPCKRKEVKHVFQFSLGDIQKRESYLVNDALLLRCECTICFGVVSNRLEDADSSTQKYVAIDKERKGPCTSESSSTKPSSTLLEDLQLMYKDRSFCDFSLKTETETFPVHRIILSARSPVFKAMFTNDMKENENRCVQILDVNPTTVRRMLLYVYTDVLDDHLSWKDALDLYVAGDKYQIYFLKQRCSSILKSSVCSSNACEILVVADMHRDQDLKSVAQDCILSHDTEIIHLEDWKNIEENNPQLSTDLLRRMVSKRQAV